MTSMKDDRSKLDKALKKTYCAKKEVLLDEGWQMRVMHDIRKTKPLNTPNSVPVFTQFIWRLAPVACILILILAMGLAGLDFSPEYELAQVFFGDPIEFTTALILGM